MIGPESVLTGSSEVPSVEIDGEIVFYDDAERRFHRLNASAAALWRCLDGRGTLAEIAGEMAEVYGIDPDVVLAEVLEAGRQFLDEGLADVAT